MYIVYYLMSVITQSMLLSVTNAIISYGGFILNQ